MTEDERDQFERDGYLVVRSVLTDDEVAVARAAILRFRERRGAAGALHQLSAVTACPELAFLLDHPRVFGYVWSLLGWNIHVYHSHVDVHPQLTRRQPDWWHWHQDGGRQNRELETDPRPRMSVKLAYWLSDVSEPGRGNFTVLPGSHRINWLPGPPRRDVAWPAPQGAVQITANAGDVVVFDRRLWHARSDNYSPVTRVGAFFGYTYRWVAGRDDVGGLPRRPEWATFSPVQRQLLGGAGNGDGDHAWGHEPSTTPLYGELANRGLLDGAIPALIR
ncbi:phytanoyl-CoA dioxygenase family protein [Mangrovihabitans endophyticus]|nr:phytanoyl-CoA dioxygenase family protein [Mangrovihabitans endophyticus]